MKTKRLKAAIGQRMQEARTRAQVTQPEAGAIAGVSGAAVSNWEAGRSMPTVLQFRSLLIRYGDPGYKILFGENRFELTPTESKELAHRMVLFSPDLQRRMEMLLTLLATTGADQAQYRQGGLDFEPSIP